MKKSAKLNSLFCRWCASLKTVRAFRLEVALLAFIFPLCVTTVEAGRLRDFFESMEDGPAEATPTAPTFKTISDTNDSATKTLKNQSETGEKKGFTPPWAKSRRETEVAPASETLSPSRYTHNVRETQSTPSQDVSAQSASTPLVKSESLQNPPVDAPIQTQVGTNAQPNAQSNAQPNSQSYSQSNGMREYSLPSGATVREYYNDGVLIREHNWNQNTEGNSASGAYPSPKVIEYNSNPQNAPNLPSVSETEKNPNIENTPIPENNTETASIPDSITLDEEMPTAQELPIAQELPQVTETPELPKTPTVPKRDHMLTWEGYGLIPQTWDESETEVAVTDTEVKTDEVKTDIVAKTDTELDTDLPNPLDNSALEAPQNTVAVELPTETIDTELPVGPNVQEMAIDSAVEAIQAEGPKIGMFKAVECVSRAVLEESWEEQMETTVQQVAHTAPLPEHKTVSNNSKTQGVKRLAAPEKPRRMPTRPKRLSAKKDGKKTAMPSEKRFDFEVSEEALETMISTGTVHDEMEMIDLPTENWETEVLDTPVVIPEAVAEAQVAHFEAQEATKREAEEAEKEAELKAQQEAEAVRKREAERLNLFDFGIEDMELFQNEMEIETETEIKAETEPEEVISPSESTSTTLRTVYYDALRKREIKKDAESSESATFTTATTVTYPVQQVSYHEKLSSKNESTVNAENADEIDETDEEAEVELDFLLVSPEEFESSSVEELQAQAEEEVKSASKTEMEIVLEPETEVESIPEVDTLSEMTEETVTEVAKKRNLSEILPETTSETPNEMPNEMPEMTEIPDAIILDAETEMLETETPEEVTEESEEVTTETEDEFMLILDEEPEEAEEAKDVEEAEKPTELSKSEPQAELNAAELAEQIADILAERITDRVVEKATEEVFQRINAQLAEEKTATTVAITESEPERAPELPTEPELNSEEEEYIEISLREESVPNAEEPRTLGEVDSLDALSVPDEELVPTPEVKTTPGFVKLSGKKNGKSAQSEPKVKPEAEVETKAEMPSKPEKAGFVKLNGRKKKKVSDTPQAVTAPIAEQVSRPVTPSPTQQAVSNLSPKPAPSSTVYIEPTIKKVEFQIDTDDTPAKALPVASCAGVVLNTDCEIQEIQIEDSQICDTLELGVQQLAVIGKKPGETRIRVIFKDETVRPALYCVQVENSDANSELLASWGTQIETTLNQDISGARVSVFQFQNRIFVKGILPGNVDVTRVMQAVQSDFVRFRKENPAVKIPGITEENRKMVLVNMLILN